MPLLLPSTPTILPLLAASLLLLLSSTTTSFVAVTLSKADAFSPPQTANSVIISARRSSKRLCISASSTKLSPSSTQSSTTQSSSISTSQLSMASLDPVTYLRTEWVSAALCTNQTPRSADRVLQLGVEDGRVVNFVPRTVRYSLFRCFSYYY